MMDGTYFIGRNELLSWINETLSLNYTKVEQCASGAAYCQLLDMLYPVCGIVLIGKKKKGQVRFNQVDFNCRYDYDFVKNWKVVQNCFDKCNIEKQIAVDVLIKAGYQDNLEFMQWFKRYFEMNYSGEQYDPIERRKSAKAPYSGDRGAPKSSGARIPAGRTKKMVPAVRPKVKSSPKASPGQVKSSPSKAKGPSVAALQAKDKKIKELTAQIEELTTTVESVEKERDFYFSKLREVEILCQTTDASETSFEKITAILYATDEENTESEQEEVVEDTQEEEEEFTGYEEEAQEEEQEEEFNGYEETAQEEEFNGYDEEPEDDFESF